MKQAKYYKNTTYKLYNIVSKIIKDRTLYLQVHKIIV